MNESAFDELNRQEAADQIPHVRPRNKKKVGLVQRYPWLMLALAAGLVVLLLLSVILGMKSCAPKPSIQGRWNLDSATIYEFYPDGKGALVLTTMTFEFTYTIDGDQVSIDFVDERATDTKYEFAVTEELLMLMGGPNDNQTQHILKREK